MSFGGETALADDTISRVLDDLKRVAVVAIVVNLVLLALFMRALVAPLYLVAASVLGLLASLGLTTLFFQKRPRRRGPHVLRPVRRGGAARRARLGLQRLRRGAHLGGGAPLPPAGGDRGRDARRRAGGHRRRPRARRVVRAAGDRAAALVPRVRVRHDRGRARRHVHRPLAARPGPDVAVRRGGVVAGAPRAARRTRTTSSSASAARAGVGTTQAERATRATLCTLAERITRNESRALAAQLPARPRRPIRKAAGRPERFPADEFVAPRGRARGRPGVRRRASTRAPC